jgi:hypothetical protein
VSDLGNGRVKGLLESDVCPTSVSFYHRPSLHHPHDHSVCQKWEGGIHGWVHRK